MRSPRCRGNDRLPSGRTGWALAGSRALGETDSAYEPIGIAEDGHSQEQAPGITPNAARQPTQHAGLTLNGVEQSASRSAARAIGVSG
jgi:hypothetical protein